MEKEEFLKRYLVDRRGTDSMKWDGLKEKFGEDDLTAMWVADMEFQTCDAIREALFERCRQGVFGYTVVPDHYYEAYSDWMEKNYNFPIKKEWVRFTTGCVTALAWVITAFTKPGDACLILTPVYYPFHNVVTYNGRKLVTVDLKYQDGYFTPDYEAIEKAITENQVKLFLQCSPHNPAGRVWTEEELDRILAICEKHDVLVASDEIHQDLVFADNHFVPAAAVANGKYRNRIITVNSASKTFNLATLLHAHILITDEKLRKVYDAFACGMNRTEVSIMGMTATEAGYRHGEDWLSGLRNVIYGNYCDLKAALAKDLPKATLCSMEGTYLPLLDLRDYVDPEKTQEVVQGKCRLGVDYGEWFGDRYKGFIRLNLATDPKFVKEAAARLADVLKK